MLRLTVVLGCFLASDKLCLHTSSTYHYDFLWSSICLSSLVAKSGKVTPTPRFWPYSRIFLLVLATGRSAPTTLKNMLHNLLGVRMLAGENDNALRKINKMIQQGLHSSIDARPANLSSYWQHNPVPSQVFACVA